MKPNYFIVGAPKCGTTTLAYWLNQTDSVFMCDPKEPHHYASDYKQTWTRFKQGVDSYEALFEGMTDTQVAAVDGSTNYLWSRDAIPNIMADPDIPHPRFIVCLRNPVDMARSLHGHSLFWGNETLVNFETAWNKQPERAAGNVPVWHANPDQLQYKDVCSTGSQVERMLEIVPRDDILFVLIDDLATKPQEIYRQVLQFMCAAPNDISFESKNVTRERKSNALNSIVRFLDHYVHFKPARKIVNILNNANARWNVRPARKSKMDPAFRVRLVAEFEEEISKLETYTGLNLQRWRR